jgi:hypothetical protein
MGLGRIFIALSMVVLTGAAAPSAGIKGANGGLWEIEGLPGGKTVRQCFADPALLARIEHRGLPCSQSLVSVAGTSETFRYNCPGSGFGQAKLTLITPRSLRVETQGISGGLPFNYVAQARRIGNC